MAPFRTDFLRDAVLPEITEDLVELVSIEFAMMQNLSEYWLTVAQFIAPWRQLSIYWPWWSSLLWAKCLGNSMEIGIIMCHLGVCVILLVLENWQKWAHLWNSKTGGKGHVGHRHVWAVPNQQLPGSYRNKVHPLIDLWKFWKKKDWFTLLNWVLRATYSYFWFMLVSIRPRLCACACYYHL